MTVNGTSDTAEHVTRESILRVLLRTFIILTLVIAVLAFADAAWDRLIVSALGCSVYLLLLAFTSRLGVSRAGFLTTLWYFILAAGAMAEGRGVNDITTVLFPAGMLMCGLLLPRRYLPASFGAGVALFVVAAWSKLGVASAHTPATPVEIMVGVLLLITSAAVTWLVVRRLEWLFSQQQRALGQVQTSAVELQSRVESLNVTNALANRLHRNLDIDGIARETVDVLVEYGSTPMVAFYVVDELRPQLRGITSHGFTDQEKETGRFLPLEHSLSGEAIRQRRVMVSGDLAEDSRVEPSIASSLAARGARTAISIPLIFDGLALGTINLINPAGQALDRIDVDTYEAVAQTVSLAIMNSRHLAGLEFQAYHDSLTALPNRADLHRRFMTLVTELRSSAHIGVVLLDINRFREINEALGHKIGDKLLTEIGSRLSQLMAASGATVFRLGGDEFAALVPALVGSGEVDARAQELAAAFGEPFEVAGLSLEVGASIGVAAYPKNGRDSHELLRCADVAMYRAKQERRAVVVYSDTFDENTPARLALISELGRAIREGALTLHFQPKVSLGDGRVVGFEALARWTHPRLGAIPPTQFLPLAEASDMINPLTWWVVESALTQLQAWSERFPALSMAINLSVRNLLDRNCAERLEEIIERTGVDPKRVEFELTETAVVTDPEWTGAMLGRIRSFGARLAIDDFGTGYSSLAYLQRFPVNVVKIDRSFVMGMKSNDQSRAIVHSTVQLARSLGLTVVAEGIEDRETAEDLLKMGCDLAQGFYFARPAPAEEMMAGMISGRIASEWVAAHTM